MARMNAAIPSDAVLDEIRFLFSQHELKIDAALQEHFNVLELKLADTSKSVASMLADAQQVRGSGRSYQSASHSHPGKPSRSSRAVDAGANTSKDTGEKEGGGGGGEGGGRRETNETSQEVCGNTCSQEPEIGAAREVRDSSDSLMKWKSAVTLATSSTTLDLKAYESNLRSLDDHLVNSEEEPTTIIARILKHSYFELFTAVLVMGNAVLLGIQADTSVKAPNEPAPLSLWVWDVFFTFAFTTELLARICTEGMRFVASGNKDRAWNLFDTFLVSSAVIEFFLDLFAAEVIDLSGARILRLLRVVRILRAVRILRFFADLRVMVVSVSNSTKPFLFAMLLLFLIIYIFAVVALQMVAGSEGEKAKMFYGSLGHAIYTLFLSISGGVDWNEAAAPLIDLNPWFGVVFCAYVAFCVFCVLNIVTGIFVDNASQVTALDERHMMLREIDQRKQWIAEVKQQFQLADLDRSGTMEYPEFKASMEDALVQVRLKNLGIDVVALEPWMLFQMFDVDGNGKIDIDEFATSLQYLHGTALAVELARMGHTVHTIANAVDCVYDLCESNRQAIERTSGACPKDSDYQVGRLASSGRVRRVPSTGHHLHHGGCPLELTAL